MSIRLFIPGDPKPQGSKKSLGNNIMVESCGALRPWRESIRWALQGRGSISGPVIVHCEFVMRRPKSASPRKPTPWADKRNGDIDKLCRAVGDALTSAGTIEDDCKIVSMPPVKRIAEVGEMSGVWLTICSATPAMMCRILEIATYMEAEG
jgi:crossover junction endodeoxyribonuclease RusA